MALRALGAGMRAGQREAGGRVVELRPHPLHCVVAECAVLRKARGFVVRIVGCIEVVQVARQARGARQSEIVVDVTLRALRARVRASQREACGRVVKFRSHPLHGVVAGLAGCGKIRGPVIRIRGVREIRQVTARARRGCTDELATDVALHAGHSGVLSGERESRELIVVECSARPRKRGMAERAILRKRGGHVVRIIRGREIIGVAAITCDGSSRETVTDMALRASQRGMRSGQREARELAVIESGALPHVHAVAVFAGCRKIGRHMVQRRPCLIIPQVARDALRAQPGVHASGGAVMAIVAGGGGVSADQREPIIVIANGGNLNTPTTNAMTLLAIRSKLAAMEIRMAFRAARRRLRKHQAHVAAGAGHILVKP